MENTLDLARYQSIQNADGDFVFKYDQAYLERRDAFPISLTLPLRAEPYVTRALMPFFDGLISEGWLLDIAIEKR